MSNFSNQLLILALVAILFNGCASNSKLKYQSNENLTNLDKLISSSTQKSIASKKILEMRNELLNDFPDHRPNKKKSTALQRVFITEFGGVIQSRSVAKVKNDGVCAITYQGRISREHSRVFYEAVRFLDSYQCNETLVKLESSGGEVLTGIKIGLLINQKKWHTLAWKSNLEKSYSKGGCHSACALSFLGGKERYGIDFLALFMPNMDSSHIGFHQIGKQTIDGKKECINDPTHQSNLLIYEYLSLVSPENSLLLYAKILDRNCNESTSSASPFESRLKDAIFNKEYTNSVQEKYK